MRWAHHMDILKLPVNLRRALIHSKDFRSQLRRCLSTYTPIVQDEHPAALPSPSPPASALLTLSSSTLNSYNISYAPNTPQLKYAAGFFQATPPQFLFSASHFRVFPQSPFPEVAFLGRSNVGKSSLLNALFGRTKVKDAHVSKRPGRTKTMNGFGVAGGLTVGQAPRSAERTMEAWRQFPRGGLVVVDMPGYGSGSREEWGTEIMKYLENRKQLRRTFVLLDCEHGLKATDVSILTHLRQKGISHQIVLSKVDKLLYAGSKPPGPQRLHNKLLELQSSCTKIRQRLDAEAKIGRESTGDILCCSAEKSLDEEQGHRKLGIDEVRWSVLGVCGMDCDQLGRPKRQRLEDLNILSEG